EPDQERARHVMRQEMRAARLLRERERCADDRRGHQRGTRKLRAPVPKCEVERDECKAGSGMRAWAARCASGSCRPRIETPDVWTMTAETLHRPWARNVRDLLESTDDAPCEQHRRNEVEQRRSCRPQTCDHEAQQECNEQRRDDRD